MAKSIISDPNHVPQKKFKRVIEFPNGKHIPKEMQGMVANGVKLVDEKYHNDLLDIFIGLEELGKAPMMQDREFELYSIPATSYNVFIYDNDTNQIWQTKDSNPEELMLSNYE